MTSPRAWNRHLHRWKLRIGYLLAPGEDFFRVRSEERLLENWMANHPCRSLRHLPMASARSSDTLFILGSGSSVNELTPAHWAEIRAADSIGFNFWLIHPFVPTTFFYETSEFPERNALFVRLLQSRLTDYSGVRFLSGVQRWHTLRQNPFESIPADVLRETWFFTAYDFPTIARWGLGPRLRWWQRRASNVVHKGQFPALVHHRSTADVAICYGAVCGYRKIVLAGIDLTDSRYFWETDPAYSQCETPTNVNPSPNGQHAVVRRHPNRLPLDEYILRFRDAVLTPQGIELLVANPRSKLHPEVPLWVPNEANAEKFEK